MGTDPACEEASSVASRTCRTAKPVNRTSQPAGPLPFVPDPVEETGVEKWSMSP